MSDEYLEQCVQACAVYQRAVALVLIDTPPGAVREERLAEALDRGTEACTPSQLLVLHSLMATATPAAQESLRRLHAWGLDMHVQKAMLPRQRALQAHLRTTTCLVDEESIPLLASFSAMAGESRRDRRAAIEAAVGEQLETSHDLFAARFEELRRVAAVLGYASLEALWADIVLVDPATLEDFAVRVLEATQDVYGDLLAWAVKRRLDVPLGQLRRHDVLALFTFAEYQQYYQPGSLLPSLQASLHDMGLDPYADGRLVRRERTPEFGPSTALAVQVPDEVVLCYPTQVGGLQGAAAYASAYGRALLWAYTSAALPLVQRLLGNAALLTGNAQFLAEMIASPRWLRHYLQVSVDGDYWQWRRLDRLYRLRRQLGRFLYTRHVSTTETLVGAPDAYREIMMTACQADYASAYYLADWDWQYASVAFCRGLYLAVVLLEVVRQQCGYDWFWNPDSGAWLRTYWHGALGSDLETLPHSLSGMSWDATLFADMLTQEDAW
jgi:hypothetical protein